MKSIHVQAERAYDVQLGANFQVMIEESSSNRSKVAIFFSEKMQDRMPRFVSGDTEYFYFPLPDGESAKSITMLQQSWNWLGAAGFTRSDLIIGVGGGAVTDFAGFVAATWLRGVDWIAVPTTLAGMVDAAIGGKTGINSDYGKNLIGSFYSPLSVVIDFSWLASLSDRDFAAGLAEVIKCGFIKDPMILDLVDGKTIDEIRGSLQLTEDLIAKSVSVKAQVVSSDFKEGFEREILNYGHTFGHAVELHSNFSLRHGECVSIGMAYIAHLSSRLGLMDITTLGRLLSILRSLSLPVTYSGGEWPDFYAAMKLDKKSRGKTIRFVAVSQPGKTQRLENLNENDLIAAYEKVRQ